MNLHYDKPVMSPDIAKWPLGGKSPMVKTTALNTRVETENAFVRNRHIKVNE